MTNQDQTSDTGKIGLLKPPQFKIVMAILLEERPLMNKELVDLTQLGDATIKRAVSVLSGLKIIYKPNGRYGGWALDGKVTWDYLPAKFRRLLTPKEQDEESETSDGRAQSDLSRMDENDGRAQNDLSKTSDDEGARAQNDLSRMDENDGRAQKDLSKTSGDEGTRAQKDLSRMVENEGKAQNDLSRTINEVGRAQSDPSTPSPHVRARGSTTTTLDTNIKNISNDQVSSSKKRTRRFSGSKKSRKKKISDFADNTVEYWLLKGNIGFESEAWYGILDKVADRDDRVHHVKYHVLHALFEQKEIKNGRLKKKFDTGLLIRKLMDGDKTPPERCEKCLELEHDGECEPEQVASPFENYTLLLEDSEKAKNNPPREDESPAEYERRLDITLKSKNTQIISGDYDDIIKR